MVESIKFYFLQTWFDKNLNFHKILQNITKLFTDQENDFYYLNAYLKSFIV